MTNSAVVDAATVALIVAALLGSGGIGSLVIAYLRRPQERDSVAVEQAARIATAAASTVDNLQEELERCGAEIERLRTQRDALRTQIADEREKYQHEIAELDDQLARLLVEKHELERQLGSTRG